jgi:hypothetical protein
MTDASRIGRLVLDALDRGRAIAIEEKQQRAALLRAAVLRQAADDEARGRSPWGRPGRIARKLRGLVSERHVRRILSDVQSSPSDSACCNPVVNNRS